MKFLILLAAGIAGWADGTGQTDTRAITVCMDQGVNSTVYLGQRVAAQVLRKAGVIIDWRSHTRSCMGLVTGIVVRVSYSTSEGNHPGALAYALPYEGMHIMLFWDRLVARTSDGVPTVLGHVLAHEIIHMLQGSALHSTDGVMKARWDNRDFVKMQRGTLLLTEEDIRLIHNGMAHGLGRRLTATR